MYVEITHDIEVAVEPIYVSEQSCPEDDYYFFAYHVKVTNRGQKKTQLLSRHWIITDGHGQTEEVIGEGVIGKQPTLDPGESFTYTSACPLPTPTGNMRGTYQLIDEDGRHFNIRIPLFFLRHPSTFH